MDYVQQLSTLNIYNLSKIWLVNITNNTLKILECLSNVVKHIIYVMNVRN